ncbi:MAG: PIN domain nuclease [bacterium]|nr:PIN domain nuclease [bacterium]
MVVRSWLIDKSAIERLHLAEDAAAWAERIGRGLIRISTVTRLEVGYSARSATDHRTLVSEPPMALMPVEYLTPKIEDRALELQSVLAENGQHRAPSLPDLLIAATAELAELTVLHLDKDFELIAQVTGQPTERLNAA